MNLKFREQFGNEPFAKRLMEEDFIVVLKLTLLTCKKEKIPCGLGIFPFIL
jgi:hypothetical protein